MFLKRIRRQFKVVEMFYWLVDRFLLKDRPDEKHLIILERYLGELPRNIGISILSSAIVLLIAVPNTSKYALITLFACSLLLDQWRGRGAGKIFHNVIHMFSYNIFQLLNCHFISILLQ